MPSPLVMGVTIGLGILLIGAIGVYRKRQDVVLDTEDAQVMAVWEMHTAIALDDND